MMSHGKLRDDMRLFLQRVRSVLADAVSEEPLYDSLGPTLTALLSSLTFTLFMAMMAVDMARRWQSSAATLNAVTQYPTRFLFTLAIIALWTYGLMRFFGFIGWPRWWVLPYVFLILCPWAWIFAYRIEKGGDFMALALLRSPVIVAYVRRIRNRGKRKV